MKHGIYIEGVDESGFVVEFWEEGIFIHSQPFKESVVDYVVDKMANIDKDEIRGATASLLLKLNRSIDKAIGL